MTCKPGPGTTHHLACDCREEQLAAEISSLRLTLEEKDAAIDAVPWTSKIDDPTRGALRRASALQPTSSSQKAGEAEIEKALLAGRVWIECYAETVRTLPQNVKSSELVLELQRASKQITDALRLLQSPPERGEGKTV